jgi:hypothetical protein
MVRRPSGLETAEPGDGKGPRHVGRRRHDHSPTAGAPTLGQPRPDQAHHRRTPDPGPEGPRAWGPGPSAQGVTGSPIRWAGPILGEVRPSAAARIDPNGGLSGIGRPNQPGSDRWSRPSPPGGSDQPGHRQPRARWDRSLPARARVPGPAPRLAASRRQSLGSEQITVGRRRPRLRPAQCAARPRLPGSRAPPALPEAAARRCRRPRWLPRPADRR